MRRPRTPPGILGHTAPLDPTVDNADEVGPQFNLVMRPGGEHAPLPVMVASLEFDSHWQWLEALGADPEGPDECRRRCP